ncbi:phosphate ABC transporter permease PstA [soil metagenome]
MSIDSPVRPSAPQPSMADSIMAPHLPRWAPRTTVGISAVIGLFFYFVVGFNMFAAIAIAWVLAIVVLPIWSLNVEGKRKATDRMFANLVTSTFGVALIPLISIMFKVISEGWPALSSEFLTYSMRNVVGEGGGIYHAIVGTLLMTLGAAVISIPIGLFTSIYLVEYGKGNRLSRWITLLVDVMTGIPSIVAGLFAYSVFSLLFGPGIRMGIGGSVALSVLMIPVVVRSTEEMLKLVPNELREAAYALGVPKWRTILKVVLPTSIAGIVTGVTLSIARVIGETAPLLVIAGYTASVNFNLFDGRMASLPVFAFSQATQPGAFPEAANERAWGAALVLMIIVMILNLIARLISYVFSPKGER